MNWFKKLFGVVDRSSQEYDGLPLAKDFFPMPEVKPCKPEKSVSEPVHVIVKNMLEHPQRWKVKIKTLYATYSSETRYTVKDTKTGEEFKVCKKYLHGFGRTRSVDKTLSWLTEDEADLIEETLNQVYKIKKERRLRLVNCKERQERIRLLGIYQ